MPADPKNPTDPVAGSATDPADPAVDPAVDPATDPATDPNPDPATDPDKDKNRAGYEQRRAAKEAADLRKELDGYKRREDEARKAKLTDEQRLKEERDTAVAEAASLRAEALRTKVATEFKLPAAMAARLIGSDEDALRADAAELAKLLPKPKVGTTTDPVRDPGAPGLTLAKIRSMSPAEINANWAEVQKALKAGR